MTRPLHRLCRWLAALVPRSASPHPPGGCRFRRPSTRFVLSGQATAPDRIRVRTGRSPTLIPPPHFGEGGCDVRRGATGPCPMATAPGDEFFGDVERPGRDRCWDPWRRHHDHPDREVPGLCRCRDSLSAADPHAEGRVAAGRGRPARWGSRQGAAACSAAAMPSSPMRPRCRWSRPTPARSPSTAQYLLLRLTPAPGYYSYRDKLSVSLQAAGRLVPRCRRRRGCRPRGPTTNDEHFGDVAAGTSTRSRSCCRKSRSTEAAATGTPRSSTAGLPGTAASAIRPMTRRLLVACVPLVALAVALAVYPG